MPIDTVRYYYASGAAHGGPAGGYRIFTEQDLRRLRFIRRATTLGFTLEESRPLAFSDGHPHDMGGVRTRHRPGCRTSRTAWPNCSACTLRSPAGRRLPRPRHAG